MNPQPSFSLAALSCLATVAAVVPVLAQSEVPPPSEDALRRVLRERIDAKKGVGTVVGWIDAHGNRVVGEGRAWRDRPDQVSGRTVFEIGSVSKVFTSLLLALAVERGEVKLDDPVSKYLPPETKLPTRNGKQITLLDLATHRSGLPRMPANFTPKDPEDPYADYTPEQMYAFLSGYTLMRDIGAQYEYSNLGVGLLGNSLARRAEKSYEELVTERICQPLGMTSTGIVLPKELQARLADPFKEDLSPAKNWNLPTFAGAGALRSDAEDMLRFLAAQMGLTLSPLAAAIHMTQQTRNSAGGPAMDIGLSWHIEKAHPTPIIWHNGGTGGYRSFIGFDPAGRRGVVVLSNTANSVDDIGFNLLHQGGDQTAKRLP